MKPQIHAKLFAVAIFLCMVLTSCIAQSIGEPALSSDSVATTTQPTVTTTVTRAPDTNPVPGTEDVTSSATTPAVTPEMTDPEETTSPATTSVVLPDVSTSPVTTPVVTSEVTTPPATQPPAPPETVLDAIPKASDVVGQIPKSPAADVSWFDDACFIGDSVSLKLKTYCLTGALGKASFFTVGSYSTVNALKPVSQGGPHPSYQGVTMLSEDCVAKSGAKKVYIMLGMNDLVYGIDATIVRYEQLVDRILQKSPDVEIFIQSMTPMTSTSNLTSKKLNNDNVKLYNQNLKALCEKRGWFFVDIASVMYDDAGEYLRAEYCSDPVGMGVHFSSTRCVKWVEYLRTHTVDFTED